jgi:hypothetical protein
MAQYMPKDARCARCDLPIGDNDVFVAYRFGGEVRFWHNRGYVPEDCWRNFLLDQVRSAQSGPSVHGGHALEISAKRPAIPPVVH